ncbi:MAG TPA: hypothetical protein VNO21_19860, partial [Polyangiaceae bacterium]|nr:hypothetical protein [Polyangiaceae bacterium]
MTIATRSRGRAFGLLLFLMLAAPAVGGALAFNALLGIQDVTVAPDSSTDEAGRDPTCQPSPADDPTVIRDDCGIFAAPTGRDDNAGTRAAPVKTLGRAIGLAQKKNGRVYLCATTYPESLVIGHDDASSDLSVYGGLACGAWTYSGAHAVVQPSQAEAQAGALPLRIDGAPAHVTLDGIDFNAAAGSSPGQSSVAGYVSGSSDVTLRRASFTAEQGVDGASAPVASPPYLSNQATPNGNNGDTDPISG